MNAKAKYYLNQILIMISKTNNKIKTIFGLSRSHKILIATRFRKKDTQAPFLKIKE